MKNPFDDRTRVAFRCEQRALLHRLMLLLVDLVVGDDGSDADTGDTAVALTRDDIWRDSTPPPGQQITASPTVTRGPTDRLSRLIRGGGRPATMRAHGAPVTV